jgi:hypothetical protein
MSANPRPVAAVWLRNSGASLLKRKLGCLQMRFLWWPFGTAIQVRVFKTEPGCPQMRFLWRLFGFAIQVGVFKN